MYRYLTASIVLFLLMPLPSSALKAKSMPANTSTHKADVSGHDTDRATPKYFVEVYELAPGKPPSKIKTKIGTSGQKIAFEPIDAHRESDQPFGVRVVSDPGLPVTISVKSGPATVSDVTAVPDPNLPEKVVTEATVTVADAGTVVLEANQSGDAKYKALKAPVTASFQVAEDHDYCLPGLVPRKTSTPEEKKPSSRQADAIVAALGNPVPFSFEAAGSKHILIYSSRWPLNAKEQADLAHIKQQIAQLVQIPDLPPPPASSDSASSPPEDDSAPKAHAPAYRLEVQVPHAGALSDLKQRIDTLGRNADFTVEDIGSDKVLITAAKIPPCHDVTLFLQDIRHLAWQTVSQPAVAQVYHLDPSNVAQSLGGGGGEKTAGGSTKQTKASAPAPAEPAAKSSKTSKGPSGKTSGKGGSTKGSTGQKTGSSKKDTSSDSADDPPAQDDSGADDTTADSSDQSKADNSDDKSASGAAAPKPSASVTLVDPDLLLLSGAGRGDDAGIPEKRRILAQLDLPRPVMLITAWSMQASTNKPEEIGQFKTGVERAVSMFNDGLQQVLFSGWSYLKDKMADPAYFEPQFYRYLVGRFVGDPRPQDQNPLRPPDQVAEDALGNRFAKKLDVDRNALGICRPDEYCLGYTNIFEPLQPRFTDLLLAILASQNPWQTASDTIGMVEGCGVSPLPCPPAPPEVADQRDCQAADRDLYMNSRYTPANLRPRVYLQCFYTVSRALLSPPPKTSQAAGQVPGVGQARAAIADFLFNYKMSQQYPHDFDPYFLTLSAQNLDSTLAPFIDEFNRDITAYQQFLREQIGYCGNPKSEHQDACLFGNWFGEPAATFINDGLISVRTLSRAEATVSAQTQNFLSDTEAPTLADFLSSLSGGSTGGKPSSGKGGGAKAAGAAGAAEALQGLEPLPVQLGLKALTMAQSSQVQIGKSLFLDVKPHSLPGASSAEIEVTMKADDTAPPVKWVAGQSKSTDANVSRVAAHDTTTSVRVDSIKLFEISSFSAELEKSRSRIPILPVPFLEVPYIGSILGIPRAGAKEFHSSTAVLSAIVVPTASDLAFGLTFTSDRIVDAGHADSCLWLGSPAADHPYCRLRKAQSLSDLDAPIGQFHRLKVACLGTGSLAAHPLLADDEATIPSWTADACKKLSFESAILQDAN